MLVLFLWSAFMVQFLRADFPALAPQIARIKNPFAHLRARHYGESALAVQEEPETAAREEESASTLYPETVRVPEQTVIPPQSSLTGALGAGDIVGVAEPERKGVASFISEFRSLREREEDFRGLHLPQLPQFPAPPPGFASAETKNFLIYRELPPVSQTLLDALETLHGNLMLDLISFSPWTRDARVLLYFFISPKTYLAMTGRPAWSGGASSVSRRLIYVLEESDSLDIISHELTHIYFDSFFNAARPNPLWLSEGMAVFIQTGRGQSPPPWLKESLAVISAGGGYKFRELMKTESLENLDSAGVRLWYAQSYSVVRFLMRMKTGDEFYTFCKLLRDGMPVHQCLVRAYGMPFNRFSALEYAWRHDIQTNKAAQ